MDDDEEEMASMRASGRYGGGRAPAPGLKKPAEEADDSDDGRGARSMSTARSQSALKPPSSRDADMSDDGMVVEEDNKEEIRRFFPVAFGKVEELNAAVDHSKTKRTDKRGLAIVGAGAKGSVQFGRRLVDSVTAAGAERRKETAERIGKSLGREGAQEEEQEDGPTGARAGGILGLPAAMKKIEEDEDDDDDLPVSHEVAIAAHDKSVTAMALDPKAARMVTGSFDGCVKFYDFNGMNEEKSSFRSLEPVEGHMVQALSFSTTGGVLLVVCSDSHARIYDREGTTKPIQSTIKGDMYVRDMTHTNGHTQMLTGGMWHPFRSEHWLTSSLDGTLRLWDINATPVGMDQVLPSIHVLKTVDQRNVCVGGGSGRSGGLHPTCCAFSPSDAKHMVAGCSDGSVQVFLEKARYQRPDRVLRKAHTGLVSDVSFVLEGGHSNLMITRSVDASMKVWDIRMLSDAKGPVKIFEDLQNGSEKAGVCTSPDGKFILTGVANQKGGLGKNSLRVFDAKQMKQVRSIDFGKRAPVRLAWPMALNQLIVGASNGEAVMLYNPKASMKGALHFVGRHARRKPEMEIEGAGGGPMPIFNMTDKDDIQRFYSTGHGNMSRIRKGEVRHNQKTMVPPRPQSHDGPMGAQSDSSAFAAAVLKAGAQRLGLRNTQGREEDSQKALLAYADHVPKDMKRNFEGLVNSAYDKSQPTKLLDWSEDVSEGDSRMQAKLAGDFCRKCGQKVCRCVDYSIWGKKGKKPRT